MAFSRVCCLVAVLSLVHASNFLSPQVTKELVEATLLEELASAANSVRIGFIKEELRPMYASLPKNEQGQLEPSSVRYALHRYFVWKHGWYVSGLSQTSGSLTNSSSATILVDLAPAYLLGLFEKQMHHKGMQLDELAIFAATMSDLVYSEGVKRLQAVYELLNLPMGGPSSLVNFNLALRGYLSTVAIGFDAAESLTSVSSIPALEMEAREVYDEYDALLMWVEDIRLTRSFLGTSQINPFQEQVGISSEEINEIMHDLYHKFGSLNNIECAETKERLVSDEYHGTGRVSVAKFYADTQMRLRESVGYIRNLGSLDESIPGSPSVIIPNYMSSPSRCFPFSTYFSTCCPDDCESVLGHIEKVVAEPRADPISLIEIVSNTPSHTQPAPRNISDGLARRLDEIAARHHGRVPLHGRLFMQWLHHAYPRECPFPHVSGTINPVTQDEWILMNSHIDDVLASDAERERHANSHVDDLSTLGELPWTDVEELVAENKSVAKAEDSSCLRLIFMVVAVLSFLLPLVRGSAALLSGKLDGKVLTHLV